MGIGVWELLLILLIVLVIFGARRLPELGAGLGKSIRDFQKSLRGGGESEDDQDRTPPPPDR